MSATDRLTRTRMLLGDEGLSRLQNARLAAILWRHWPVPG